MILPIIWSRGERKNCTQSRDTAFLSYDIKSGVILLQLAIFTVGIFNIVFLICFIEQNVKRSQSPFFRRTVLKLPQRQLAVFWEKLNCQ